MRTYLQMPAHERVRIPMHGPLRIYMPMARKTQTLDAPHPFQRARE